MAEKEHVEKERRTDPGPHMRAGAGQQTREEFWAQVKAFAEWREEQQRGGQRR